MGCGRNGVYLLQIMYQYGDKQLHPSINNGLEMIMVYFLQFGCESDISNGHIAIRFIVAHSVANINFIRM